MLNNHLTHPSDDSSSLSRHVSDTNMSPKTQGMLTTRHHRAQIGPPALPPVPRAQTECLRFCTSAPVSTPCLDTAAAVTCTPIRLGAPLGQSSNSCVTPSISILTCSISPRVRPAPSISRDSTEAPTYLNAQEPHVGPFVGQLFHYPVEQHARLQMPVMP